MSQGVEEIVHRRAQLRVWLGLRFSRAPDLRLERCKISFGRNLVPDGKRFESAREAGQHLVEGVEFWRVTAVWTVELHFGRWLSFRGVNQDTYHGRHLDSRARRITLHALIEEASRSTA